MQNIQSIFYMLAQNAKEINMTKIGVAFFLGFLVILLMHTTIKDGWLPKSNSLRFFVIILFILVFIALILILIFL